MNEAEESADGGGYSSEQVDQMFDEVRKLRNEQPSVQLDLSSLAQQLTIERAKTFANEAMGRRLPVIEHAVTNIFKIYPPSRTEFLTKDECTDIAIQLHAFAINVYAIFDNAAWVCVLEGGGNLAPVKIGLLKKECQKYLPPALQGYISNPTIQQWFHEYGKIYRDSTAHRIPPYLPIRNYTHEEGARWQELHEKSMEQLLNWKPGESHEEVNKRLGKHNQLEAEKDSLGRNSLFVALTSAGEDATNPIYLHPQLLSDWSLVQEFVSIFTKAMRQHYGWKTPYIPSMVVN